MNVYWVKYSPLSFNEFISKKNLQGEVYFPLQVYFNVFITV
jgi:hypothetical protein